MTEYRNKSFERKRRKLESYIELKYDVESKHDELINLANKIDELTGVQGIRYSDMPKGGKPVLFTDYIDKLVDIEKILNNSLSKAEKRKKQIEIAIDNINDSEIRTMLKMRYIDDYSDSKIGGLLNYDRTTIWKKCNNGIKLIKL